MAGYQYNGSAEVKLKVRLLGDVSSLSLVSLELVVTPLIMNCQADHSRHIFRCGNNTPAYQGQGRSAHSSFQYNVGGLGLPFNEPHERFVKKINFPPKHEQNLGAGLVKMIPGLYFLPECL